MTAAARERRGGRRGFALAAAWACALVISADVAPAQDLLGPQTGNARDATGEGLAFVALETASDRYFVEQPIRLRVVFGFEESFRRESLIQLFRRDLDVPAQIDASWTSDSASLRVLPANPLGATGEDEAPTFALGDEVVRARRLGQRDLDDRRFDTFELEVVCLPLRAGELAIPEPTLRFAHATRVEDDFTGAARSLDRSDAFVRGGALHLAILPWPEAGRPPAFTGAVGRFAVRAAASPRELEAGQSLKLTLEITCPSGDGNLESFAAPRLDALAGFRVYGSIDEKGRIRRVLMYDLAPSGPEVTELPPIAFAYLDPEPPAAYHTIWTEPIALTVRPAAAEPSPTRSRSGPGAPFEARGSILPLVVMGALAALIVLGLAVLVLTRVVRRRG